MKETLDITNQELDELFERYRQSPDSFVFVLLADACRKIGRIDEALEICETGITRHPVYASGHVVKGKCLYDLGRHDDAGDAFRTVFDIDENNLVALKYLGMIDAKAGRFKSARGYLQHILRIDPENREIKQALLDVDEQEQLDIADGPDPSHGVDKTGAPDHDEVEKPASIDLELETSDELATITLADIFASQGYKEKALKIYEEVLAKEPGNESIKKRIAMLSPSQDAEVASEPIRLPGPDVVDDGQDGEVGFQEIEFAQDEPQEASVADLGQAPATASEEKTKLEEPPRRRKARREIDEDKNINHFKRWLSGLSQ